MILLGLGSNMRGLWGSPAETLARAVSGLDAAGVTVVRQSSWYVSAPFGRLNQPAFVNGVIAVETYLSAHALLAVCHRIERSAGRLRRSRWGPRTLDIDLLTYHEVKIRDRRSARDRKPGRRITLTLPHPGIADRQFVLVPIHEIAKEWRHPVTRLSAAQMLQRLRGRDQGMILEII